ncbi:MAG: hypothetical protein J6B55_02865 [Clostridia bacterium]|nr:hypothetical protein [Clostridia bacterium]
MSKEAIRQIKETEEKAEQIRAEAASRARSMIAQAEQQANELRANVKDDAKKALESDLAAMRKKSEDLTEKNRTAAKDDAQTLTQTALENMKEAVKLIISEVTEI